MGGRALHRDREILPVGQDVNGDEIDRRGDFPDTEARMRFYERHAFILARQALDRQTQKSKTAIKTSGHLEGRVGTFRLHPPEFVIIQRGVVDFEVRLQRVAASAIPDGEIGGNAQIFQSGRAQLADLRKRL